MKSIEDWKKEYEQDEFCGTEFKTPKGGVLTVVGIAGKQGRIKMYACHCSICHQDEQMFPELETSVKCNLVNGSVPCACSKSYHWNDRQRRLRLANKDYEIISQESITGNGQKVKLKCSHDGYEWEASVSNLLNHGSGCQKCASKKNSESMRNDDPITPVMNRCLELDIKFHGFVGGEYKNAKTRLDLECHCGNKWKPSYDSFVTKGTGCPACAKYGYSPDKAGVFYVVHWHKRDKEFLKIGITNRDERRITHQMNSTAFTPTILYFPTFSDGNVAVELERECKQRIKELYGRDYVASKEDFPDGYTETMNVDQYDWINELVFESTMCRLKPLK